MCERVLKVHNIQCISFEQYTMKNETDIINKYDTLARKLRKLNAYLLNKKIISVSKSKI